MRRPRVLTVAGSDPGGGAGVQADCVTLAAWGCHPLSAITALTVQDTRGVAAVEPVAADLLARQIRTLLADGPLAAAKCGMLPTAPLVEAVADALAGAKAPFVLDPVGLSGTGHPLQDAAARDAILARLLPLADVTTPNADEAAAFSGLSVRSLEEAVEAARALQRRGARAVLVKGGHLAGDAVDVLVEEGRGGTRLFRRPRVATVRRVHGAGCALSAALAAALARGLSVADAAAAAGDWVHGAIERAYEAGEGALALDRSAPPRERAP